MLYALIVCILWFAPLAPPCADFRWARTNVFLWSTLPV